jgi:hypothetical protein
VATPDGAHFTCELRAFATGRVCYGPDAIRAAYGLKDLLAAGFNGQGQTIVIIDAFGSPTVEQDLAKFDTIFGIPAPPSFTQIHMPGSKPFDYTDLNQVGWAQEVSLDVQWSHAIAPGAKIIVVAAVDNSDPNILDAQNYAISHKLGFIISESFGESEYALVQSGAPGLQDLSDNEKSYRRARREHISATTVPPPSTSTATSSPSLRPIIRRPRRMSRPSAARTCSSGPPSTRLPLRPGRTRAKSSGTKLPSAPAAVVSAGRSISPTIRRTACLIRSGTPSTDSAAIRMSPTTRASARA